MDAQTDESPAESVPETTGPAGRHISISAILVLLTAVILVPALIFSAVVLQRNNDAQQAMLTTLAQAAVTSISETVDRHLIGKLTTLRVLSTSRALQTGNLEAFYDRANEALAGTETFLILADADKQQVFDMRVPFGTQLDELADTQTADRALATGNQAVSDIFNDPFDNRWVFNIVLPVETDDGRQWLLVLVQSAESLAGLLSGQSEGGWNSVLVDRSGVVLASSFMASDVGNRFFLSDVSYPAMLAGRHVVAFEGRNYDTIRSFSAVSGWETVVWAPSRMIQGPMVRTLRFLILGGLSIFAVGMICAWVLGRQITRPIRRLARDARRLGEGEEVVAFDPAITEIATVSQALALASQARITSENEIRFLMREVAHRSKNQLTVVSSIAKQTARHARSFDAFQEAFQERVQGLARSTDLLIAGGVAGVELKALVETQIGPFAPTDAARVSIKGPVFRLSNQAAQTLGLALHELATNAAKYGAFSTLSGRLSVTWKRNDEMLEFVWREHVPSLQRDDEEGRGFGTEVIERMLGGALDAEIERVLHDDGLECRFVMPLERLEAERVKNRKEAAGA